MSFTEGEDLSGYWAAAPAEEALRRSFPAPELDDSAWQALKVPGHWRSEPAFAGTDGPLLYRKKFEAAAPSAQDRAWLVMEGVFYQSDVWLDGSYLGDTEGYFFPHEFEVTELVRSRREHVLAVEVSCPPGARAGRALLGAWGDPTCVEPSYNPGGIWAPVRLARTGVVRVTSLRLACTEARPDRAVLVVSAVLDSAQPASAELVTEARLVAGPGPCGGPGIGAGGAVAPAGGPDADDAGASTTASALAVKRLPLVAGQNRASWRLEVASPELWWPAGAGPQCLYDVSVSVRVGEAESDRRVLRTGLRQVRTHQMAWEVNGERLFLRGADLAPTRRDLAAAAPEEVARDIELAGQAGLNLLRVRGHVGRRELYDAADRAGMLVWQDLPRLGADRRASRHQAVRQAHKAVSTLGSHPSIVAWCAGGEGPVAARLATALRRLPGLAVVGPGNWLATRSVRRVFERADRSRPALARPGTGGLGRLVAGPPSAVALQRVAAGWPSAVRFVALSAGPAVPEASAAQGRAHWPSLDSEQLSGGLGNQAMEDLLRRFPPGAYADFESWGAATQRRQAELVRSEVEALRRLRSRPVQGFSLERLNDAQPGVSCSLLDHRRQPKMAWGALAGACSLVLVVADWPAPMYPPGAKVRLGLHVVNDLRTDLEDLVLQARLTWPGGGRTVRFAGRARKSSCSFVGRLVALLPSSRQGSPFSGPLRLELVLRRDCVGLGRLGPGLQERGEEVGEAGEVVATNSYESQIEPF